MALFQQPARGKSTVVVPVALLLFSSSFLAAQSPLPPSRSLRIALEARADSLDPAFAVSGTEAILANQLCETLVARDPKTGRIVPRAASAFSISSDGLTMRFVLRKDLAWSNGKRIRASDFEYSIRRILDPANQSPHREKLLAIRGSDELSSGSVTLPGQLGVASEGDGVLRIDLRRPSSSLLAVFAQPWTGAVSKDHVERYLNKWTTPEHWVGGGVFIPAVVEKDRLVLKKNRYHRFAPLLKIDEALVSLVASRKQGLAAYLSGKVDVFGQRDFDVPDEDRVRLSQRPDLVAQPDFYSTILRLNTAKVPFSQEKLRQAISMAIDRDLLLSSLGSKGESAAFSLIPGGYLDYEPPSTFLYGPQKAKKTLGALGYCLDDAQSGCSPLPLVEIVHLPTERHRKIALALSVLLRRNLGWKSIDAKELSEDEFLRQVSSASYAIALDELAVLPEHPFGFLDAFRKDRSTSGGFAHREFEKALDDAELSPRWEDARKEYRHAEGILLQDGGIVPIYFGATYLMVSPRVRGFDPNVWDDHPWSQVAFRP